MKTHLYLLIFIFGLLCLSCETTKQTEASKNDEIKKALDSWKGSHKSKLIQSWGAPTRTASDGNGGEILIYEQSPKTAGTLVYGFYIEKTVSNYTEMYADKNGIIYYWRYGRK